MPLEAPINHIFDHTPESLAQWCKDRGMPGFRAKQILGWVYEKGVIDPAQMTDLSVSDRQMIADGVQFLTGFVVSAQEASDGVRKLLVQWHESKDAGLVGNSSAATAASPGSMSLPVLGSGTDTPDSKRQTECVLIPTDERMTACISSQVGCPVGCKFCASGLGGLDANLSAGRIVEQVWRLGRLEGVGRVSNVVFMGMGEPLSNFEAVTGAIRTMNALWGLGISARKITISTVGLPKFITRLRDEFELPVTLALSLHAPTDDLRRQLIPWSHFTTIEELLAACAGWFEKTGREITLEYTLLRGINDSPVQAARLAELAQTLRANVNLIRFNEVGGVPFNRPRTDDVLAFQKVLRNRGVNVHIRASRGRDIAAACGQLRHESKRDTGTRTRGAEVSSEQGASDGVDARA